MSFKRWLPLLLVFVVFLIFLNRYQPQTQSKSLCRDCNIVIIAYDALQAKHVSHLGYPRPTTPMLDSFAKQGVSFSNAISAAPWTVPSYMSIFTGLYPSEHRVVNKFVKFSPQEKVITHLSKLSPKVQTLAQVLKENGYATGGFTGDAGVHSQFGYSQGFDIYTDEQTFGSFENSGQHALDWLSKNKDKKFFMFFHGYDAHGQFKVADNYQGRFAPQNYHGPFKGTPEEQAKLREEGLSQGSINLAPEDVEFWRSWYDSKIRDADERLAHFWQEFEKLGVKDKTIVVILSDHGTEFYEHKRLDHGHTLYDELIHVPLVFVVPGVNGGKIKNQQVTTLDVVPTLLDLVGIKPNNQFLSQQRGKSLVAALLDKDNSGQDVFSETDYRDYTHKRGIRTQDGWKFILTLENNNKELYQLADDPEESKNVLDNNLPLAFKLEQRLREHLKEMGTNPDGSWTLGCLPVYNGQCQ